MRPRAASLRSSLSSGVMVTKRYGAGPRHSITSPVKVHSMHPSSEMRWAYPRRRVFVHLYGGVLEQAARAEHVIVAGHDHTRAARPEPVHDRFGVRQVFLGAGRPVLAHDPASGKA